MASSETQIANLALGKFGQSRLESISSNDSAESRWCLEFYPHARDIVTEQVAPRHARKTQSLAELSSNDREDDFEFAYEHPSDAMAVLYLLAETGQFDPNFPIQYEAEGDTIYTDEPSARIVYVRQSTDVTKYPPSFTEAVATYLAHMLVPPLKQDKQLAADMLNAYLNVAMPKAVAATQNERVIIRSADENMSDWHRGR